MLSLYAVRRKLCNKHIGTTEQLDLEGGSGGRMEKTA